MCVSSRMKVVSLLSLLSVSLACACSTPLEAPSPVAVPPPPSATTVASTPEQAIELLRTADTFEDTHVGYGGELSRYVAAFRVVLADPGAARAFHSLVDQATPAGRLYGAAGLYFADPPAFDAALEKIRAGGGNVRTMHGCMRGEEPIASVIRADQSGSERVVVERGTTLAAWFAAHRTGMCDLAGGCVPLSFVSDDRVAPRDPAR